MSRPLRVGTSVALLALACTGPAGTSGTNGTNGAAGASTGSIAGRVKDASGTAVTATKTGYAEPEKPTRLMRREPPRAPPNGVGPHSLHLSAPQICVPRTQTQT